MSLFRLLKYVILVQSCFIRRSTLPESSEAFFEPNILWSIFVVYILCNNTYNKSLDRKIHLCKGFFGHILCFFPFFLRFFRQQEEQINKTLKKISSGYLVHLLLEAWTHFIYCLCTLLCMYSENTVSRF